MCDRLRLCISHQGIAASVVTDDGWYFPFVWTPGGINTSQIFVHPRGMFALDMMLACIWRDACVIRERWSTRGQKSKLADSTAQRPAEHKVVFPRAVYKAAWGSSDSEREAIERASARAHAVRGCYPTLQEGHMARDSAERASKYGWPEPPPGHTFRRPHTRGEGEAATAEIPVVYCRGLQVAKILLS